MELDYATEIESPRQAKPTHWVIGLLAGVAATLMLVSVAGAGVYVFSGPSEQEIQDKHWEYEKLRGERAVVNGGKIAATNLRRDAEKNRDGLLSEAERKAEIDHCKQQEATFDRQIDELTQSSLMLERKYAKYWVARGYKVRP